MDSKKTIDMEIERRCPICGGKHFKELFTSKDEALNDYNIPDFLIIWIVFLDGRHYITKKIEDFLRNGSPTLKTDISQAIERAMIRLCVKCNHVWNIFDETEFVLCSNDKTLIHNYMSLIENCPIFGHIPLSWLTKEAFEREKIKIYKYYWMINLIKAKLYQYKYKNHSDIQSEENYNYYQLFKDALQNAEKYHTDNENLLSYEYEIRADMSDDTLERFNLLNAALTSDISTLRKDKIRNNINGLYSTVLDRWKQPISIEKRRIIFIANNLDDIAGYYDPTHSINHFFTIDRIPASIKFPYGQPTGNELYIANPVKPDEYVPYDNFEFTLFKDRILELKRLLRSLGATEITFTCKKGISIDEAERMESSVNAEARVLGHKASVDYSLEERQNRMSSQDIRVDYIERLDSYEYPSLPEGLHWYYHDPDGEWQAIVKARLHHNQLHFEQSISTKQVSLLNEQSQMNVNAAYEGLICKINANYHREREFHVKTTEETMWRITAEFKPLSEFENNQNTKRDKTAITDSSTEQEYIKAVKQFLEDGEISEPERHFLNRKRDKLGISEQRALELEASLATQSTEDEQAYLNLYRQYAEAGEVTEKQRLILDDAAKTYGLSSERVKHLEAKN